MENLWRVNLLSQRVSRARSERKPDERNSNTKREKDEWESKAEIGIGICSAVDSIIHLCSGINRRLNAVVLQQREERHHSLESSFLFSNETSDSRWCSLFYAFAKQQSNKDWLSECRRNMNLMANPCQHISKPLRGVCQRLTKETSRFLVLWHLLENEIKEKKMPDKEIDESDREEISEDKASAYEVEISSINRFDPMKMTVVWNSKINTGQICGISILANIHLIFGKDKINMKMNVGKGLLSLFLSFVSWQLLDNKPRDEDQEWKRHQQLLPYGLFPTPFQPKLKWRLIR